VTRLGRARLWLAALSVVAMSIATLAQTPASAPSRTAQAEAIADAIFARDFARVTAQFDETMKAALPGEAFGSGWDRTAAQIGKLVTRRPVVEQRRGPYTIDVISCQFEKAALDITITFNAAGQVAGIQIRPPVAPWTPPSYATAGTFVERDVTVGAEEWALPGTLTLPTGPGPFPALVLVHGSGPNDRDESVGPNKTFKDLALGLASRGVAVLRYDKRTLVHSLKAALNTKLTVKDETIDDAVAAVALLRSNPAIDAKRIFVLGHSLGGMLIPRIGAADPSLAGLIVMAGLARPLDQTMVEQLQYLAEADGIVTPSEQQGIDDARRASAAIAALTPDDLKTPRSILNAPASYWLDLRGYDPPAVAARLPQRLLILQGARDYQVTTVDFERWKTGLAGRKDVEFHLYPALNHLFLAGIGKSLPAEYAVPGHVPEEVIKDIADWIKRQATEPGEPGIAVRPGS
jgi:dienelactone hydrolase